MACCWICLQSDGELSSPCSCPRLVHPSCLACWQIHSAGTPEEHSCRFCSKPLPSWRSTLGGGLLPQGAPVPIVAVLFEGQEWRLKVPPTPEGALRFQKQIELITGLPFDEQVHIKFYLRGPTGQDLSLSGTRCLEASIHCAAIHCAKQHQQPMPGLQQQQPLVQPQPAGDDALATPFQHVIDTVQHKQLAAVRAQGDTSATPPLLHTSRSAPASLAGDGGAPGPVQGGSRADCCSSSSTGHPGATFDNSSSSGNEPDSQLTSLSLGDSSSSLYRGSKIKAKLLQLWRGFNSLSLKLSQRV